MSLRFVVLLAIAMLFPGLKEKKTELVLQTGHSETPYSGTFSPDGQLIVTTEVTKTEGILWDVKSGRQLRRFKSGVNPVFLSDGKTLLSLLHSTIQFLDIETGKLIQTLEEPFSEPMELHVTSDDLIYVADEEYIYFLSPGGRPLDSPLEIPKGFKIASFSPDDKFASVVNESQAQILDLENRRVYREFKIIQNWVPRIKFSPDSRYAWQDVTPSDLKEKHLQIFDITNNRMYTDIVFNPALEAINMVGIDPKRNCYIITRKQKTFSEPKTIEWRDLTTGRIVKSWETSQDYAMFSAFSPDQSLILVGDEVWDLQNNRLVTKLSKRASHAAKTAFWNLEFSPDNNYLAYGIGENLGYTCVWDLRMGKPLELIKDGGPMCFLNNSEQLLISAGSEANIYSLPSGRGVRRIVFQGSAPFGSIDASSDSKNLAAISREWNKTEDGKSTVSTSISVFDLQTGASIAQVSTPAQGIVIRYSADNKYVLALFEKSFVAYNAATLSPHRSLTFEQNVKQMALNRQQTRLAILVRRQSKQEGPRLNIYSWPSVELTKSIQFEAHWDDDMVWSADGKYVYVSGLRNVYKLDVAAGEAVNWYGGYFHAVTYLALSADGAYLATASYDGYVVLWDTATDKEACKLIYLNGSKDIRHNSIGTSYTRQAPDGGALLANVDPKGPAYAGGIRKGDIVIAYNGAPVVEYTDYTAGLLRRAKKGESIKLKIKRGTSTIDANVTVAEQILKWQPSGIQDWIIVTPELYYMASSGISRSAHFVNGTKFTPFENYDLIFNRPDKVVSSLGLASPEIIQAYANAYQKRLVKMGFGDNVSAKNLEQPVVKALTLEGDFHTDQTRVTIGIEAFDQSSTLNRINVYANEVAIHGSKGISISALDAKTIKRSIELELSHGKNIIKVSVHNSNGVESLKESIEVICQAPKPKPDLYVLTLGVSDYDDDEYDLTYAAKDAKDLALALQAMPSEYGSIKVKTLTDQQVTLENIRASKTFLKGSRVDDCVVLFFAGHGVLDDKLDYYLATCDMNFNQPGGRGLAYEELESLVDGIPARRRVILIDACHSGEIDKEETELVADQSFEGGTIKSRAFKFKKASKKLGLQTSFELMRELFSDLRRGTGAVVISSASGTEFAFESQKWKNGIFTYCVLAAIDQKRADTDYSGSIEVSELQSFVSTWVTKMTYGKQTPTARKESLEFDFRVF